jgi:hypothetical protein
MVLHQAFQNGPIAGHFAAALLDLIQYVVGLVFQRFEL